MRSLNVLKKRWDEHVGHRPHHFAATITDAGIVLGAEAVLMRMKADSPGTQQLAIDSDEERLATLLGIAYLCQIPANIRKNIENASEQWRRGDRVLAHFHLAFARLPRLESIQDVYRLYLAESLIDDGVSSRVLLRQFGVDRATRQLVKFDPNQQRVPAGSGRESGQWTKEGDTSSGAGTSSRRIQVAGDVVFVGKLIGSSVSRYTDGSFPTTTCTYESLLGDFTFDYVGIVTCPGMRRVR